MKKLTYAILAGLMVLATTSVSHSVEQGRIVTDSNLYKHQWDVAPEFNLQCKVKSGQIVKVANRISWSGQQLIHLRTGGCDGWTYARNFKSL